MKKVSKVDWSKKDTQKTTTVGKGLKKLEPVAMDTIHGGGTVIRN